MAENQNFASKGETGYGDPFEGTDEFNILQFINEDEITLDNLFQQQHYSQQNSNKKSNQMWANADNSYQPANDAVLTPNNYSNNNNMHNTDSNSPLFTDISAAESSSSEPDQYNNFDSFNTGPIKTPQPFAAAYPNNNSSNNANFVQVKSVLPSPTVFLVPECKISPGTNLQQQQQQQQLNINIPNNNYPPYYPQTPVQQQPGSKRKRAPDGTPVTTTVKHEYPPQYSQVSSVSNSNDDENCGQPIFGFSPYSSNQWTQLYDSQSKPLTNIVMSVIADKGFNFGAFDGAFINQKKNHFQITIQIELNEETAPTYVRFDNTLKKIADFKVDLCGVKSESPTTAVNVKQSDTDRRTIPYDPISIQLSPQSLTKITLHRLHFSETTMNNNRKYGRPNPEQKYFNLLIKLIAIAEDGSSAVLQSFQSDRFIVRATNPAQFEHIDSDVTWQKNNNVIHYPGPVAVGTDKPISNAQLTVLGNIVSTGTHTRPSDRRVKDDIIDLDTAEAMNRLKLLRIVEYDYKPEFASSWGLNDDERHRVGVIAQELAEILPDAVRQNGEFMTVDDSRIFYDTVAATQEISRVTESLEHKLGEVQTISAKIARFVKNKNMRGSMASGLTGIYDDGTSMLSYSRASLNSDEPRRQRRDSDDLCSTRVTQRMIVTLVFVMSICLLAMSSLYVLDWYNRTYVYKGYIPVLHPRNITHDYVGNMVEQKYRSWIPEKQPSAPVLAAICGLKDTCPNYCCAGPPGDFLEDLDNSSTIVHPLRGGVEIKVVNLDMAIDQRYCVNNSCNHKYGYHNLYVPISPFLPTVPLLLQFYVPGEKYVDNCGNLRDFEHHTCHGLTQEGPTSYQVKMHTFELNAGEYSQSAFRFRVGYTTESCLMSDDQQGRSFDEYNIIFYRKCTSVLLDSPSPSR